MTRFSLFVAAALATVAVTAQPHLRFEQLEYAQDMEADFSVEKHMKCSGGLKGTEETYTCCGMMSQEFSAGCPGEKIADQVATVVHDEVTDFMGNKERFSPRKEQVEAISAFDDLESLDHIEDGFTETIELVGTMKADWSCNVTVAKKDGKFTKKMECGFNAVGSMEFEPEIN